MRVSSADYNEISLTFQRGISHHVGNGTGFDMNFSSYARVMPQFAHFEVARLDQLVLPLGSQLARINLNLRNDMDEMERR